MKTLYFDCAMGAAGDMLTAALLELHPKPEEAVAALNAAFAGRAVLSFRKDSKCGIQGTHVTVRIGDRVEGEPASAEHKHHHHHHTSLREVQAFIGSLPLPAPVVENALQVYALLAEAESAVHGQPIENIHFHEVGSLDAMADVVSVCFLLHELAPERILASPINVGKGTVRCAHGILSVPAPATLRLLRGVPIYAGPVSGELCTPTGAALLRHFVESFCDLPLLRVEQVGCGTGSKDLESANILRAIWGVSLP